MTRKLLIGDRDTILLLPVIEVNTVPNVAYSGGLVPYNALTDAVYDYYIPITTPGSTNAGAGGNITCAVQDDYTLGSTDPEVDDSRTVCSVGQDNEIKRYNFEAEFNIFRDADSTDATSVFNLATDLVRAPDIPYIIAHRIGYSSTTASAVGQKWNLYYVHTDNPVDTLGDDEWQIRTQSFVPKNIISYQQEVTA